MSFDVISKWKLHDAKRIKDLASFPKYRHVVALYQSANSSIFEFMFFFNRKDLEGIKLFLWVRGVRHFLISIQDYEKYQEIKSHKEAKERLTKTFIEAKRKNLWGF